MNSPATLFQININPHGGVPKYATDSARLTTQGVEGDRQSDRRFHGGPSRAVCLYSLELIQQLQREGHPIEAGATGENLTISGLDWSALIPGARLKIGDEVILEITSYTKPCYKIRASFDEGKFIRVWQKSHPGWSRIYAAVLCQGIVRAGDKVQLIETP